MLKLSFILPCYNVAPYFGRCIESIEHQDIPQTEYEVICVDDCSKDNTVEVIKEYQKQYPNIRLMCHTENKTAGGARNTAIAAAKGQYIWCVDPDDSIAENSLKMLLDKADRQNLDVLLFNRLSTDEEGNEQRVETYHNLDAVLAGIEFTTTCCAPKYMYNVASHTCSLYRRAFLEQNHIQYPEIRSSQDVIFIWHSILLAKKVSSVDKVCYNVFRRANSTTGSKGKLRANAVISASILYANEINRLRPLNNDERIDKNLLFEMRLTLDDDSRKILRTTLHEQRLFYREICNYAAMVDQYKHLMNRKTKVIFNYHLPYPIWQIAMWGYILIGKCKR